MDTLFRRPQPLVPVRGVHLDLKGLPPTFDRLMQWLELFHAARFNAVLVEWEDTFPWACDARFRGETHYSAEQVARFCRHAEELGLELIPLVQCLGHLETVLQHEPYTTMREQPERADCLNPLAPGAGELVAALVDDVLERMPGLRYFHLGGDEAWVFGTHPDTRAFAEKHGKAALYLQHVEPLLDRLAARGIRPLLWHDMMTQWDPADLRRLGEKADLVVWGYRGKPDDGLHHHRREVLDHLHAAGVPLWGGGAFKGADGPAIDRPRPEARIVNGCGWAEAAEPYRLRGVIATAWSRYGTTQIQCEPLDGCLDLLLMTAVILHDGEPCAGGLDACVDALRRTGHGERFGRLRDALETFSQKRDQAWARLRQGAEFLGSLAADPSRIEGGFSHILNPILQGDYDAARDAGAAVRAALQGLTDERWARRYVDARLEAIRHGCDDYHRRLNALLEPSAGRLASFAHEALQ